MIPNIDFTELDISEEDCPLCHAKLLINHEGQKPDDTATYLVCAVCGYTQKE